MIIPGNDSIVLWRSVTSGQLFLILSKYTSHDPEQQEAPDQIRFVMQSAHRTKFIKHCIIVSYPLYYLHILSLMMSSPTLSDAFDEVVARLIRDIGGVPRLSVHRQIAAQ